MPQVTDYRFHGPAVLAAMIFLTAGIAADQRGAAATAGNRTTVEHVLNRVSYGPRPGDIDRVQSMGIAAYLEAQLHPGTIADDALEARLAGFETLEMSTRDLVREYFAPADEARRRNQAARNPQPATAMPPAPPTPTSQRRQALDGPRIVMSELMQAKVLRAVLSERQLQEVLADFWFNHFNVFVGKGQVRQYLTEYERDVIRPHVLGRFRDLLGAVAHSPAMLFYLDNWQSTSPTPAIVVSAEVERRLNDPRLTPEQRRQLMNRLQQRQMQRPASQQPRRGLNENYARELMELHTLGVDAGYTQADVVELARVLTGWTIDQPRAGGSFLFRPAMHDAGTKTLLGATFGSAGEAEGEHALDLLARHPSTARHIAFKLTQRFVADEPPPAVIARAAAVFSSTDGDLREVLRSILTSPEFLGSEFRRAKVKTPLEFVVSAVRATGATVTTAQPLVAALQNLAMPLYGCQPPTGYSMTADAWVNTGALLNRMNFATALVAGGRVIPAGRGRGSDPGLETPAGRGRGARRGAVANRAPIQMDVRALAPDASEGARTRLIGLLLPGGVSDTTAQTLSRADTPEQLIALTLGSPEFQRR